MRRGVLMGLYIKSNRKSKGKANKPVKQSKDYINHVGQRTSKRYYNSLSLLEQKAHRDLLECI